MLKGFVGWIPTLIFVPATGAAIGMGSWKGALLYFLVAAIGAPIKWKGGVMARIHGGTAERTVLCFMLTAVGTVVSGLETSGPDGKPYERIPRVPAILSAFAGKLSGKDDPTGGGNGKNAADAARRRALALGKRYRVAAERAKGCDTAHRFAAGAIQRISRGDLAYNVTSAAAAASAACEQSWMALSGPELIEAMAGKGVAGGDADQLRACSESYLGRWLVNDDLVYALKNGLPGKEVDRIKGMNDAADANMPQCAALLKRRQMAGR